MPSGSLQFGILGYGKAGALLHGSLIGSTSGVRVAAIATGDPERQARARREHPDARVYSSAGALLADAAVDVIVVATPNRTHVPLGLAALALDRARAVVVDKPIAPSAEEGGVLVAAAERAGKLLTVYQNRRWDTDFATARRLIEEGRLGDVVRVESRYEYFKPVREGAWRERAAPEEAGGVLFDLGPHLVDQVRLLFGDPLSVYAELAARRPGARVEDDAFMALRFAGGQIAHLWMSASAVRAGPRLRVIGKRGVYEKNDLDPQENQLGAGVRPGDAEWGAEPRDRWGTLFRSGEDAEPIEGVRGSHERFYELLRDALVHGGPAPVDPRDAIAAVAVLEAARESARSGRVIDLRA